MFPSLDTNGYVLFDTFNQTTMLPSFVTQIQSPSSHHHLPSPSLPFYTELFDDSHLISQFLLQPQEAAPNVVESPRKVCKKLDQKKKENCADGTTSEKSPRRRTGGKGDRHSKICTAQGPRDRRMRLSLQTARKFFDLQDMLGFDKASKTIEWLISKSQTSIKQVKESVAASGGGGGGDCRHLQVNKKAKNETLKVSRRKNKIIESSSKKKESREKARKRARERTVNKMKMRLSEVFDTSKTFSDPHQETRKMKITSSAQVLQGENQEQEWSTTNENMVKYQIDSVSIIEKFLGLTNDSSSSSILRDSEESYTTLSSIRGTNLTTGMETPREHNNTPSIASVDEERNPISSFSLYDYICY